MQYQTFQGYAVITEQILKTTAGHHINPYKKDGGSLYEIGDHLEAILTEQKSMDAQKEVVTNGCHSKQITHHKETFLRGKSIEYVSQVSQISEIIVSCEGECIQYGKILRDMWEGGGYCSSVFDKQVKTDWGL